MHRRSLLLLVVGALASMGATHRTPNFFVHAPTPQIAQQIGQYAEHYRKEKALQWLGREMPQWPQPCPLHVEVGMEGPSGATSFQFGQGQVLGMKMEIQGPLDRLLASVLPHEITHTVFAHHFRMPVPRWADEGGSVLSEDDLERERHDKLTRSILNQGRQIPLRRLFSLKEYPREVMCLYAQGYSMSDYLVKRSDRKTFLNFVAAGMVNGWDNAVLTFYGHRNVEDLEEAWLQYLRDTKRNPAAGVDIARATGANGIAGATASRNVVRMTVPPAQPIDPAPVVRGAMPYPDQVGQQFGSPTMNPHGSGWIPVYPVPAAAGASPQHPQTYMPPQGYAPQQPLAVPAPFTTSPVRLGPPQFGQ